MTTPVQSPPQVQMVICEVCAHEAPLGDYAREEQIRDDVWAAVMVCPACGERKHIYYMTTGLRAQRAQLQKTLADYQAKPSQDGWTHYKEAQAVFRRHYDRVQVRWTRKLGAKESEGKRQ